MQLPFSKGVATVEGGCKGRTPKIFRLRQRSVWVVDSQSANCHHLDGELSVYHTVIVPWHIYIIVHLQLVFNRFFCFLYEILNFISHFRRFFYEQLKAHHIHRRGNRYYHTL